MNKDKNLILSGIVILLLIFNMIQMNRISKHVREIDSINNQINYLRNEVSNLRFQTQNQPQVQVTGRDNDKKIMSAGELAGYLDIDISILFKIIENKDSKIPYLKVNDEYKFSKAAIDEWLKSGVTVKE